MTPTMPTRAPGGHWNPLRPEDRSAGHEAPQKLQREEAPIIASTSTSTVSLMAQHKDKVLLFLFATNLALLAYLCAKGAFSCDSCRKKQFTQTVAYSDYAAEEADLGQEQEKEKEQEKEELL